MKIAVNGSIYWNCPTGTLFLENAPSKVTLKAKRTTKGKSRTMGWICLSLKSGSLKIYSWSARLGVRNISYSHFSLIVDRLVKRVSYRKSDRTYAYPDDLYTELCKAISSLLKEDIENNQVMDSVLLKKAMPFLHLYDNPIPHIPRLLRQGLKQTDIKVLVQRTFGIDSKLLVKKVAALLIPPDQGREAVLISIKGKLIKVGLAAMLFKFPNWQLDHIHKLLDINLDIRREDEIFALIKGYNPQRVLKLLAETPSYYLNDAASMYGKVIKAIPDYQLPKRPRNAQELHDYIMRDFNRLMVDTAEKKKLPTDKLGDLEGMQIGSFTVCIPSTAKTLIEWGNALNICIGSYADRAKHRACYLIGIEHENAVVYAIEVSPKGEVIQFAGHHNSSPNHEDRTAIILALQPEIERALLPVAIAD